MKKISIMKCKKVCYIYKKEFSDDDDDDDDDDDHHLKCLGENTEKYITLSVAIKKNFIMVKQLHTN